jgi:hypothetical protein
MASERQIAANRRNAQLCTGPKTERGKRASRLNACKHGMCAQIIVLPYEDDVEYHQLRASLIESYAPANSHELFLVDQISAGYWRTMRARAYEKEMLTGSLTGAKIQNGMPVGPDPERDDLGTAVVFATESEKTFNNYFRYDASIERQLYRSLAMLEKVQARRVREYVMPKPSVSPGAKLTKAAVAEAKESALAASASAAVAHDFSVQSADSSADGEPGSPVSSTGPTPPRPSSKNRDHEGAATLAQNRDREGAANRPKLGLVSFRREANHTSDFPKPGPTAGPVPHSIPVRNP